MTYVFSKALGMKTLLIFVFIFKLLGSFLVSGGTLAARGGTPLAPNELPWTILEGFWLPSGVTAGPKRVLKELQESPREPKRAQESPQESSQRRLMTKMLQKASPWTPGDVAST